ncbi:uncharacterized protein Z520_11649 [Fonsecaea multimorphosa CBS 102226]|uniref:Arginine N-methyltransferase 2 n=1 Tax=Fonsecaea multimorphosa CBS 102226 TaxID=1442371 RepID=A0A0D2GT15_9EURO|nr:uncharacterized protein Z520_11649 [Fonsecaea multimorphosa CBS 102226]KIX92620.1 hypothetical protein Z520_11649 [Fonsecaea multimorphosa CBS 102226]OAL17923.1 hypothetical protein AYO22_11187 [Fonsecaea multimorphosa]
MATPRVTGDTGSSPEDNIQEIIHASANHDIRALQRYIDQYSFPDCKVVDVQDPLTGFSPLHAAISTCATYVNGGSSPSSHSEESGTRFLKFLLENGAIWNQLDKNDETPGCVAYRLGLHDLYQIMVDAGVRAEMVLNRLEGYERLRDDEDGEEIDGAEESQGQDSSEANASQEHVTSSVYLSSALSLGDNRLLDEQQNGVMMAWESDIMLQSANALLAEPGLKILNIGFGMGIIDNHIQAHVNRLASHHIVEAHPDVLGSMERNGWMEKPNVVVHRGKWQNILPQLITEGETFDAIYFDTFAESYSAFRDFFSEQVIGLLNQHGRWSFFNGMGADRQISYDVYQKVVEFDLYESDFDVEWETVELPNLSREWEGVRRKYWNIDRYRLPICKFMD